MNLNFRVFFASLLFGLCAGTVSVVVEGCGAARLTPEEASAELDVACSALVRTLVEKDEPKAASVTDQVCHAEVTKALIERAAQHFEEQHQSSLYSDQAPLWDAPPSDAGVRHAP